MGDDHLHGLARGLQAHVDALREEARRAFAWAARWKMAARWYRRRAIDTARLLGLNAERMGRASSELASLRAHVYDLELELSQRLDQLEEVIGHCRARHVQPLRPAE